MRLLHFVHPDRLVLTDFHWKSIPQYAILSHRWGDSEIFLEDIGSGTYKEKDAYRKLQFCAAQAAQDKLQYFWIDTCCIDRWDLHERSRAINSMFLWYKNATRCYVFLSDVSVPTATKALQHSSWETSFRASAWFTRGWTLQELIAPVSVEFFSCEGWQIGDKMSLDQLVHEITSIPLAALRNDPLDQFTISERARWSENRKTTEEEDIVYCLLGVLGVSMPTSYGEGKESASRRLQAEVEAANSAPCIIPFSQNDRFAGRELQLAELEAKLFSDRQSTRLAIVGPRGTGKSQLALEVAHRTRQKNKNGSVFWVDASNKDSLYQSYASIAQKLSAPGWDDEKADVTLLVKRYLANSSARQCLLIYDNAGDIPLGSSGSSTARAVDLFDYLPQSELCSIIFTTTSRNTARMLASQNIIELRELEPDLALRILDNYLSTPISQIEQREAKLLLQELSYLPLAIVQAAAYMNVRNTTLENYRSELARHIELAFKHSNDTPEYPLQGSNAKNPVAATLGLSLDEIRRSNALPADCLFLAACIDRKDIPLDLLVAPSIKAKEDAVKVLSTFALVTRRPAESALDLHGLVHQALRKWLEQQGWLRKWTQKAITQLLWVFPDGGHINRSKWRRLLPHTQYALIHSPAEDDNEERLDLVQKCAMTLYSDGRYKEAEGLELQVIEIRKRVLGDGHPDTLASIANLASTYRKQGRWKEAEELGVQVIGVMKRVLGDKHPDTLASIAHLALTYGDQGRWKEAEELEVQVMEMMKKVLGDEHPDTLTSIANLASTYKNQGRWKEAEELEVQVIETKKRVLGDEHPDTVISIGSLALTYENQGRWIEAEELGVQVMWMMKKVLGDEHPDTLASIANLASTYRRQGRWIEAEELGVQEIKTTKRVLGDEHPDTLTSIANLASTYKNQGRWKEAEELEVQVMETKKRVLGDEHPSTLISIGSLASTYQDQGRWIEAEELGAQVMGTMKKVLGDEHPDTLSSMANLASMYRDQGRWKEAEALGVQVIEIRKRVLGDEHPETVASIANLASTYRNQGRWREAEELEVQVIEATKRVLGDEHPSTLASMANLASTYRKQGRWKEAEELEVQVIEVMKKVLGDEHPDTLASMASLALTYEDQGRWKEAEELDVQVIEIRKRVLSDEHPDTLASIANLASTYRKQGRWKEAEELEVQVIETRKRVLGDEHPDTLISIGSLALTYENQGRWIEAEELGVQVMWMMKKVFGDEHPDTLASMANLASTYKNQGRWKEAEELEVQEIEMTKKVLGDEHPDTLASMASLVSTYWNQGRWKEAEELEVQVMETRKRVLGDEHPDTLASMANLASTYWDQGQWKEAFALMETCFQRRKQILGEQHPYTQSWLNILNDWRAESSEIDL